MRKLILPAVLLIVICAVAFFTIPKQLVVSTIMKMPVNTDGLFRKLSDEKSWQQWWPGQVDTGSGKAYTFTAGKFNFTLTEVLYRSFKINISKNGRTDSSLMQIIPLGKDSVVINWTTKIETGNNPFTRMFRYLRASSLKGKTIDILTALQVYSSQTKNLYGVDIKKEIVTIEFMVKTSKDFDHYPNTGDIYTMVDEAANYITSQNGEAGGKPMLNITSADSVHYKAQVAIPVKQPIAGNDSFATKAMFKGGNILTAEVTGGVKKVEASVAGFNQYILDYEKTMMAMSFQMLITDRRKETDSTKWVTALYYPVM